MNPLHVIIGAGPLGASVARSLLERGQRVRIVTRSGSRPLENVEALAADVRTAPGAVKAVAGASVVYQCAQPPYHRWAAEFPQLQKSILDVAATAGADLVLADNLYAYGDPEGEVMVESTPERATTTKGVVRRTMAQDALAAHAAGRLRVATTRPSNYFGPGYDLTGTTVFAKALLGKPMQFLIRGDQPHSFSFVPDAGAAMAAIGTSEHGWGQTWITSIQSPMTQQEFAERIWSAAGQTGTAKTSYVSEGLLRFAGLFSPAIRAAVEMTYEYDRPFIASSAAFEEAFGMHPTPLDEAITATLRAYAPERVTAP